ncbi:MAG: response regulator [Lachnospiraceae bacterium]|nr:response regulator [Lachnospiraceae bacterium]
MRDILKFKRRVLVVDDESVNRQILSRILSSAYEVVLAGDGDEALRIIERDRKTLSLVLLDLIMPGRD